MKAYASAALNIWFHLKGSMLVVFQMSCRLGWGRGKSSRGQNHFSGNSTEVTTASWTSDEPSDVRAVQLWHPQLQGGAGWCTVAPNCETSSCGNCVLVAVSMSHSLSVFSLKCHPSAIIPEACRGSRLTLVQLSPVGSVSNSLSVGVNHSTHTQELNLTAAIHKVKCETDTM